MRGLVGLFADGLDPGTLLVFAIFVIGAIAQLINKAREVQKQAGQRKPPLPPQAPEKRDPLADENRGILEAGGAASPGRDQGSGGGGRGAGGGDVGSFPSPVPRPQSPAGPAPRGYPAARPSSRCGASTA